MTAPFVFYGFGMIVINAFNGAGDTKTPTYINFICYWLLQLPIAYIAAVTLDYGPVGVFLAIALGEVAMTIIAVVWFKKGHWKRVEV